MITYRLFMDDFGNDWCITFIDRKDGKGPQRIALGPAFVDHAPKKEKAKK